MKQPSREPIYAEILGLATELQAAGVVRFPLSTDRYRETLRTKEPRQRIDVAFAMAALSGYETIVQLDTLTLAEIDSALAAVASTPVRPATVQVFGHGVMHAFGKVGLAEGLRIDIPPESDVSEAEMDYLSGAMRAAARELMQDHFEWAVLSGDPRVRELEPAIASRYDEARARFRAEEERRTALVSDQGVDARKAAAFCALQLHCPFLPSGPVGQCHGSMIP